MRLIFIFLFLISLILTTESCNEDWKRHKTKHGRRVKQHEENKRKKHFCSVQDKIAKHNKKKGSSFWLAHNELSHASEEEKLARLGAFIPAELIEQRKKEMMKNNVVSGMRSQRNVEHSNGKSSGFPESLDYRDHHCLKPIRKQGVCGSCWAFAAVTTLEFSLCKKYGTSEMLSEQQLVDCTKDARGCKGGMYNSAWSQIKKSGGVNLESIYPYTGNQTGSNTCKMSPDSEDMGGGVLFYDWVRPYYKPESIIRTLVNHGPVASSINAVESFFNYAGGIYDDPACDEGSIYKMNHAIVIVGYGTEDDTDYWIVRNSFGTSWGIDGYMLIERGVNKCNIESWAAYVIPA